MEVRRAQYSAYLGNGKLITTKHFMDYYKLSVEVISNSKFNYLIIILINSDSKVKTNYFDILIYY